jgi:hypothetical protein
MRSLTIFFSVLILLIIGTILEKLEGKFKGDFKQS